MTLDLGLTPVIELSTIQTMHMERERDACTQIPLCYTRIVFTEVLYPPIPTVDWRRIGGWRRIFVFRSQILHTLVRIDRVAKIHNCYL